ncbi:MAG: hypothetical protein PHI31_14660 [Desulfuromonadaceae bacterium]|nr:hypothetical protein [Desulfuromonadaceae bacterium]
MERSLKLQVCLGFILFLVAPLYADTYSWIDDNGTYNFTEDYSKVPKKLRRNVQHRTDMPQVESRAPLAIPVKVARPEEVKSGESVQAPQNGEKDLYGGKTRAAWRAELDAKEAELSAIENKMELLRTQVYDPKGIGKAQFETLKKEYDDNRAVYDDRYKSYSELLDTVRKAGIPVELKR